MRHQLIALFTLLLLPLVAFAHHTDILTDEYLNISDGMEEEILNLELSSITAMPTTNSNNWGNKIPFGKTVPFNAIKTIHIADNFPKF